jgi:hypothetical protein
MTPSERKRAQRQRDKLLGWSEVSVKVSSAHVEAVRCYVAGLPDPVPPTDPNQLTLIAQLDAAIDGGEGDVSQGIDRQQSMF